MNISEILKTGHSTEVAFLVLIASSSSEGGPVKGTCTVAPARRLLPSLPPIPTGARTLGSSFEQ